MDITKERMVEDILEAALKHGMDDDPDHEVGDLQDAVRVLASYVDPKNFLSVLRSLGLADR